jgi:hypothetical protein
VRAALQIAVCLAGLLFTSEASCRRKVTHTPPRPRRHGLLTKASGPMFDHRNFHSMTARTINKTVSFARPFLLKGVDRVLPSGEYRVATDEELIQELSFPAYRRVATMIFVPAESRASSIEMVSIDPRDLQEAQDRDVEDSANDTAGRVRMTHEKG